MWLPSCAILAYPPTGFAMSGAEKSCAWLPRRCADAALRAVLGMSTLCVIESIFTESFVLGACSTSDARCKVLELAKKTKRVVSLGRVVWGLAML